MHVTTIFSFCESLFTHVPLFYSFTSIWFRGWRVMCRIYT